MIGAFVVNAGKLRNVMIAALFGILLGTAGLGAKYYFQYQTLLSDATTQFMKEESIPDDQRQQVKNALASEITFWKHIEFRVEEGWNVGRGGGGAPISGVFVYLIWGIEAVIVYFLAFTIPVSAANEPFSEKVNDWASEEEIVMTLPITDQEMVAKIKSASSVEDLLEIPIPKTDESNQFAVYKVNSIEGQELEDAYLSVDLITFSVNNKGEEQKKEDSLVKYAILSSQLRQQLVDNASLLQEAIAEFRASVEEESGAEEEPSDPNTAPPANEV